MRLAHSQVAMLKATQAPRPVATFLKADGMSEKKTTTQGKPLGDPQAPSGSRPLSPPTNPSNGRWAVSPDALFRLLEDEAVILDMSSQRYFGLNPMGVRIWQLLETYGEPGPIVETLLPEFEVDEQRLRSDVDELIDQLASQGLIRPAVPPTSVLDAPAE